MKHYRPVLFLSIFCLCMVGGIWAGRQVRNTLNTNMIEKASARPSSQLTAQQDSAWIIAPTGDLGAVPTYPVPSVTETPALPTTSTPPPTPVRTATQPALLDPTSTLAIELTPITPLPTSPAPTEAVLEIEPGSSQRNILIITVDDLNAQQVRLISVWLALYVNGTQHFTLMPVYPQGFPQDSLSPPPPDPLAQVFSLDAGGDPSSEFLQALTERGAWWNATLLLDLTVAENLIDIAYQGEHLPEAETFQPAFSSDPQDAQDVFLAQAWLGQKFCRNLADSTNNEYSQLFNLFTLIPAHLRTDMDLHMVRDELESIMAHSANIICDIPVLSGGGLEP